MKELINFLSNTIWPDHIPKKYDDVMSMLNRLERKEKRYQEKQKAIRRIRELQRLEKERKQKPEQAAIFDRCSKCDDLYIKDQYHRCYE